MPKVRIDRPSCNSLNRAANSFVDSLERWAWCALASSLGASCRGCRALAVPQLRIEVAICHSPDSNPRTIAIVSISRAKILARSLWIYSTHLEFARASSGLTWIQPNELPPGIRELSPDKPSPGVGPTQEANLIAYLWWIDSPGRLT